MSSIGDCLKKRLLRKEAPDIEKARKAIEVSEQRFLDADISLDSGVNSAVILLAYASMFHVSRALLFRDGYTERSHYCLAEFIKENYINKGLISPKFAHLLNNAREERHEVLYGLEKTETRKDAELVLESARDYIKEIKKIMGL